MATLGNTTITTLTAGTINATNNIYIKGTAVSTSDERYKEFITDIDIDFDKLKKIPKKIFKWKEGRFYDEDKLYLGTSAQKVREIYPDVVNIYNFNECKDINSEDAILGVDYSKLSLVALAAIDKLYERIEKLEADNVKLKEERDNIKERLIIAENKCIALEEKLIDVDYLLNKLNQHVND